MTMQRKYDPVVDNNHPMNNDATTAGENPHSNGDPTTFGTEVQVPLSPVRRDTHSVTRVTTPSSSPAFHPTLSASSDSLLVNDRHATMPIPNIVRRGGRRDFRDSLQSNSSLFSDAITLNNILEWTSSQMRNGSDDLASPGSAAASSCYVSEIDNWLQQQQQQQQRGVLEILDEAMEIANETVLLVASIYDRPFHASTDSTSDPVRSDGEVSSYTGEFLRPPLNVSANNKKNRTIKNSIKPLMTPQ